VVPLALPARGPPGSGGPVSSLREPRLLERLRPARRVLLAGAGGGFDVYATLPLALALADAGVEVAFASLTFTSLGGTDARFLAPHLAVVTPDTRGEDRYFPERALARWLAGRGLPSTVYTLEKVGVRPARAAYRALCERLDLDTVVLVDGGTDLLMRGDEAGLGTPEEDMVSLAAFSGLPLPRRFAACLGFGIDAHHGICHAHFLENVAALEREGGALGTLQVSRGTPEGDGFLDAVAQAQAATRVRPSIVNGSIAAAVRGEFGDVQFTRRTEGSELFINPLMTLYFAFELEAVARRSLYLSQLEDTETIFEVAARIEAFRQTVEPRPRRALPH
jgi:hypothetical protein